METKPEIHTEEHAGLGHDDYDTKQDPDAREYVNLRVCQGIKIYDNMDAEERMTAMQQALDVDPGPKFGTYRYAVLLATVFIVLLNSGDTGFDPTVMSSINSMSQFHSYFGTTAASTSTSLIFGMYTTGGVIAFFFNIWLPDRVGRKYAMFGPNLVLITGAIVSANAKALPQLLVGRFLTGLGCSASNLAAKLYITEVTPQKSRGRYVGVFNSWFFVGQILATGSSVGLGRLQSEWAWRVPLYLQCAFAGINVIFVLFLHESPRWLYAHGKHEQARKVLAAFHTKDGDLKSPVVELEMMDFEKSIAESARSDKEFWNFKTLFATYGDRYRFGLCAIVAVYGQLSGTGLVTYFLPILLSNAGITDGNRQRELNLVNSCLCLCAGVTGALLSDHVGRRKLVLFSAFAAVIGMCCVSGLLSPAGVYDTTRSNAGVAFIFLFMICQSLGWTPVQATYPPEVLSYQNRAKGVALQTWIATCGGLINSYGMPVALGRIGWIVYVIFAVWDCLGLFLIYRYFVETKQLSLEQIDEIFADPKPRRKADEFLAEAKERAKFEQELARNQNA